MNQALQVIELFAGHDRNGQAVVERVPVKINDDDSCQLVKSPAFIKGIASGDVIKIERSSSTEAGSETKGAFKLILRSGNLSLRVFSRGRISQLSDRLTPELEKLGGELDTETPRMLVYSIHVSCGFTSIEGILNRHMDEESSWMYGNVYDPSDGQTPLNWWQDILKPE